MLSALELVLFLLAASILAVAVLGSFKLPALVAYLGVGVLIGPHAINIAGESAAITVLGELGVVFLMFTLGLEFNLAKLKTLSKYVFGLGLAQVLTTIAAGILLALFAAWLVARPGFVGNLLSNLLPASLISDIAAMDWRIGLVIGGAFAMSSTALVVKLLAEKHELDTEHGKRAFSVLLMQDLAVIPLLILVPAFAKGGGDQWVGELGSAAIKATVLLFVLLRFGPWFMGHWFRAVAKLKSHELFTLNVLLASLFFAWLTKQFGLSMELGAFVAGMLIAETDYKDQVEEDIKPFRDLLLGLFFVTIGMKVNFQVVLGAWPVVLLFTLVPLALKFALVAALTKAFGATTGTAIRTGLWLAQAGEFGFVVLSQAVLFRVLPDSLAQPIIAAMLISLLISPLLIMKANWLALRVSGQEWMVRSLQLQQVASQSLKRQNHIIICGYGRSGQGLGHLLEAEKVAYVALDLDPDRVADASKAGEPVVYGDASRKETLLAAGLHRAKAIAITFGDLKEVLKLLRVIKELAPNLHILVRGAEAADIDRLKQEGASEVVPEIAEGSLMLAANLLRVAGIDPQLVQSRIQQVRDSRYASLRGVYLGSDDKEHETIEESRAQLHTVLIGKNCVAKDRPIDALDLAGATIAVLVRNKQRTLSPSPSEVLREGDAVVLEGSHEQVHAAELKLAG
jgi:monovalent cation:H+ antiporter-2, CPA2 family